MTLDIFHIF